MKKPKILIIENSIDVTGALKSILKTSSDLRDMFEFVFVIPKGSKSKTLIRDKQFDPIFEIRMREIRRQFSALLLYLPFLVINSFRLRRIIKQNDISLVHVNDLYNLLPVIVRLFGLNIPYICHVRFMPDKFPPLLFKCWLFLHLKFAERVIVVSQSLLNKLPNHPKLLLIHNELPEIENYPLQIKPTNQPNCTFLYLANFISGKGHNYALDAFVKVHQRLANWKLRFVGGDMGLNKNKLYKEELQLFAKLNGIDEKIEWVEFTNDVELEYKMGDVILNFSESESFSITCLEALYFGRPLIATDCGGPSEIIDHLESGILVRNRDVDAMANAMMELAENAELRDRFSIEGRKRSRNKFGLERTSHKLGDVYKTILV